MKIIESRKEVKTAQSLVVAVEVVIDLSAIVKFRTPSVTRPEGGSEGRKC